MSLMGYHWAKYIMKKYLLIALLIMAGSVIVANTIDQQKCQSSNLSDVKTAKEVEWHYEYEKDEDGNIIGKTIVVRNYLSHAIMWYAIIVENGKKDTINKYVPANEKRMAYYGNGTLEVKKHWYEDSF